MNSRKIIILTVSFLVCLVVFLLISVITNTPDLTEPQSSKPLHSDSGEPDKLDITIGKIGDLQPGQVSQTRYIVKDKNTGKTSRILGFEKLLRQIGEDWELEKPYYKMMEKNFTCELTADMGTVQIEMVGNQPIPKDAQLQGNVIITITPTGKTNIQKSKVFLDDVMFNHTNSQFSTEGPVRFTSPQAELAGTGMQLIYNSLMQRLELLRIIDIDFIHIKEFKSSGSPIKTATQSTPQPSDTKQPNSVETVTAEPSKTASNIATYKCTFNDNVVIKYDKQMIYASQVNLSNLFFSNSKDKKDTEGSVAPHSASNNAPVQTIPELPESNDDDASEIFITCDGGVTIRPMEYFNKQTKNKNRFLELTGSPVEIKKKDKMSGSLETFAQCGLLQYDLDEDILDMQTLLDQKFVSINLDDKGSKLDTTGSVKWQKNDNLAIVNGPGSVSVSQKDLTTMDFKGVMKLYFEDNSLLAGKDNDQSVQRIDFLGPVSANASDSMLNADSAKLIFEKNNTIATADLNGNVHVKNNSGTLASENAKIVFSKTKDQKIKYIDLHEKVSGKTTAKEDFKADSSRLYFDQSEKLTQAKLKGNVILISDKAQLFTEKVDIDFASDPNGKIVAEKALSYGQATITTKNSDQTTQSSFWAEKIDYDFASGNAMANGPVKFVFYTPSKDESSPQPIPVTITAKKNAQFFLKQDKVVLNGDVVGKMTQEKQGFTETNNFYGDKLAIDLVGNNLASTDIDKQTKVKHISLTGRKVRLISTRRNDTETISAIKLVCKKMDFDSDENMITATGSPSTSQIQIDNSKVPQPKQKTTAITFKRPSYALIEFFDTLKWSLDDQVIEADGKDRRLYLGYIPVLEDGSTGKKIEVTSGYAKAIFHEITPGKTEISTVSASKGISYEDAKYQFEGDKLFYETGSSFVRITGDKDRSVLFNGVKADSIEYNLKTGKATTQIGQSPGILPF